MTGKKYFQFIVTQCILVFIAFLIVFPFFWMVISSFKSNYDIFDSTRVLPGKWHIANYPETLRLAPFGIFFFNSVITTVIVVVFQLATCSLAGFAFAKLQFKYKNVLFYLFIACMMIPNEASIISNYLIVNKMGFMDSYTGLVITSLTSVFGIFLLRQFYLSVPNELAEAARIDGYGDFKIFRYIYLPLGKTALAAVAVFGMINNWNAYMWPLIITNSTKYKTVQTGIRYLISPETGSQWAYIMTASTLTVLPMIVVFIMLQKFFIQGITRSGLK